MCIFELINNKNKYCMNNFLSFLLSFTIGLITVFEAILQIDG